MTSTYCRLVVPFVGESETDFLMTFFANIVFFNTSTIGVYLAIWLLLKTKTSRMRLFLCEEKGFLDSQDNSRRIFKSLAIISMVIFSGWTVCSAFQLLLNIIFRVGEIPSFFVELYFGVTVHGSLSVNFFILYKFRSDWHT